MRRTPFFLLVAGLPLGLVAATTVPFRFSNNSFADASQVNANFQALASAIDARGVPSGTIVMWSGAPASIPAGWALCDGTGGTPNLLDRFVLGLPNASASPGETGGTHAVALTTNELPSHTHGASVANAGGHTHTGTTSTTGAHRHTAYASVHDNASASSQGYPNNNVHTTFRTSDRSGSYALNAGAISLEGDHAHGFTTAAAGDHGHTVTVNAAGSGAAFDNRPAFYRLAFIMKL